ncbi:MAG: MBL fold metallo-hydrolase [Coriobacteriales bacterium]|nr:MBL fold metallo-hydrolase [Coriobacteriales bacterium]
MTTNTYTLRMAEPNIWQIQDVLGDCAYVVVGERAAALVDTTIGYGDLKSAVRRVTTLPLTILLTHNHYDHSGGTGWFSEVHAAPEEAALLARDAQRGSRVHEKLMRNGELSEGVPFALRDGCAPRVLPLAEGDRFELGGLTLEAVALPGHTAGSMGFLVQERSVLLSGDAVTPVMCLFLEESLGITEYRQTLAKMRTLDFERFYTGHHAVAFTKRDLQSFDACAQYAQTARGITWRHTLLSEFVGTAYLPPCETADANSPDFRALIGPYVPKKRGVRSGGAR